MSGTAVFQSAALATPGAGIVIATDNVGGTQWQQIKLDVGAAGASVPVTTAGYVSGTGVPVTLVRSSHAAEGFFGTTFTGGVTNGTLIPAPGAGTYTRVYDILVNGSAAGTAFVEMGDGTTLATMFIAANGGWSMNSYKGVRTKATNLDVLFNCASGSWGVMVNYALET